MATVDNARSASFYLPLLYLRAEAVDAFNQDWPVRTYLYPYLPTTVIASGVAEDQGFSKLADHPGRVNVNILGWLVNPHKLVLY